MSDNDEKIVEAQEAVAKPAAKRTDPHAPQHGEQKCTTCHKAHRASVNYCTQCHTDAVVPDGWLSYTDSKLLEEAAGISD